MNSKTLTALKRSIARWEKIAAGETYSAGASTCALCKLFNKPDAPSEMACVSCPVSERTGKRYCDGTPYASRTFCRTFSFEGAWPTRAWARTAKAKAVARAEVKFLKSLLPKPAARKKVKVQGKRTRG